MQTLLRRWRGYEALVVYPPVDVERFRQNPDGDRENLVVSVSRIRRGKQLESVIRVARLVEDGEFIILGLADQASKDSLESLMKTIRYMGLEDRVKFLINQPFKRFKSVLSRAKVYLHTQPMEAFGISVVEAMASGCVPVVPRLGGPWRDILELKNGCYGLGYSSLEEASERIRMLLKDEESRKKISLRARLRAKDFNAPNFEDRIKRIVRMKMGRYPS
jgi:glycosyltransferase involved in cell wall biosynthesis